MREPISPTGNVAVSLQASQTSNVLWMFSWDLVPFSRCYEDSGNAGYTPVVEESAENRVLFTGALCYGAVEPERVAF